MTDSELLEWAAKACGYTIHENGKDINGDTWYWCEQISNCWSPITDDGDALRLAVKLELTISYCTDIVYHHVKAIKYSNDRDCEPLVSCEEKISDDPYAATRRAIVRAAAAIGEQVK